MNRENFVRLAGACCLLGGVLWVAVAGVSALLGVASAADGAAFWAVESAWLVLQVLLLVGVVGLALSGAAGRGRFAMFALGLALLGRTVFVLAEAHCLAIGSDQSPLLPLGAIVTAIGTLLAGFAVLLARRWRGWRRYVVLATGVYPFVSMFPFLVANGGEPSIVLIALWGLPWALLGYTLYTAAPSRGVSYNAPVTA